MSYKKKKKTKKNKNQTKRNQKRNTTKNKKKNPKQDPLFKIQNEKLKNPKDNSLITLKSLWATMGEQWYVNSSSYWHNDMSADNHGMLGGLEYVSDVDLEGTEEYLSGIQWNSSPTRSLDCGAGIGRVTKVVLSKLFDKVDIQDVEQRFLDKAKENIDPEKLEQVFCCGLQNFDIPQNHYDLIWVQWVAMYLTDKDFIKFLNKCSLALKPGGVLIIKGNTSSPKTLIDLDDHSICRTVKHFAEVFKHSKMKCTKATLQTKFPKDLFPIHIFHLIPIKKKIVKKNTQKKTIQTETNKKQK
ncbi:alpha n-terminal protein methyltransferase 1-related [Anaeramoeba flamelloides]|uniref:Alpha N-terminal protein methyltransferase 1 n=1 Tax=Anaeramoeba flamelloides TaxID=1746091 RepID=A0ABQ8X3T3_9EUKA|nr:alpha n-terminal protein methyltransferase 1-related [Anaeramoeba flamelloides]